MSITETAATRLITLALDEIIEHEELFTFIVDSIKNRGVTSTRIRELIEAEMIQTADAQMHKELDK